MGHFEVIAQPVQERPLGCVDLSVEDARSDGKFQGILSLFEGDRRPIVDLGKINVHHPSSLPELGNLLFGHPVKLRILRNNHRLDQLRLSLSDLLRGSCTILDFLKDAQPLFHAFYVLFVKTKKRL
eukprot:CAMPEP_0196665534 /NCGR_PEP_ID=MMETSP1086-20130531/61471_1 /TAXON_ID=77921 /ORGANISM="Cyanoptyche  gloeocystis , Strain SAG4.97" /LENGTH=125 /DNA_ID=CAMNT_0042002343 /DNA_START=295 /DNA_END=672 /DNA_ORIENTATION=-